MLNFLVFKTIAPLLISLRAMRRGIRTEKSKTQVWR
jgi:hypothetical protein